jgi:hypothetical protein
MIKAGRDHAEKRRYGATVLHSGRQFLRRETELFD